MRVSEYFTLGRTQPALDFVDVDVTRDARLFIDPTAVRLLRSPWADECVSLIQDYFTAVLGAIREGRDQDAQSLLVKLREPNETHLGLSRRESHGRALGPESAKELWKSLRASGAVSSGLIEDLEDTLLLVEGVGPDIVSDITTNIIREPLVRYTQASARYYGIPLTPDVPTGRMWDPSADDWYEAYDDLPVTTRGRLLLVPKIIVRARMEYDVDEYYRHYLMETLRDVELNARSSLVQVLKDGRKRVTKKDLQEKYGSSKKVVIEQTIRHPDTLVRYREAKAKQPPRRPPLDHGLIAAQEGTPVPDWDAMLADLKAVPTGRDSFAQYEKAIESILTALFYPSLVTPTKQQPIHDGRKRVDICYTNAATSGFFNWAAMHYPAAHVFVECKNYGGDPANPELDQLSGRFSPSRGQLGLLVCRQLSDKPLFMQRCRDTAVDQHGYIIPLDDDDIASLVTERRDSFQPPLYMLLQDRFRALVM